MKKPLSTFNQQGLKFIIVLHELFAHLLDIDSEYIHFRLCYYINFAVCYLVQLIRTYYTGQFV